MPNMTQVYLAGGFHSDWQDEVIEAFRGTYIKAIDPRTKKGEENPHVYTEWDLKQIRQSSVVLANVEMDNPYPMGLCVEVGYAEALNVTVILVDGIPDERRFGMVRAIASEKVDTLYDAVLLIKGMDILRRKYGDRQ